MSHDNRITKLKQKVNRFVGLWHKKDHGVKSMVHITLIIRRLARGVEKGRLENVRRAFLSPHTQMIDIYRGCTRRIPPYPFLTM